MKIAFYLTRPKDAELCRSLNGVGKVYVHDDKQLAANVDLHCVIGLRQKSIKDQARAVGAPYLYFDKPYDRKKWPQWWRISYDAQQPGDYIGLLNFPRNRNVWRFKTWRPTNDNTPIVIGGWSNKCSEYLGIEKPEDYIERIMPELRKHTNRPMVYRAKPSYHEAYKVDGAVFSKTKVIGVDMNTAWALVTHASGICFDALLAGVPSIILGPGVTAPVSSRFIESIENPRLASDEERLQLLANIGYHQWSVDEFQSGVAKPHIEEIINAACDL
jgi:hypothetical protein